MDLICPNCQKRLTIEDKYAGVVVKCPLCTGMFQAPVLPTMPAPVPPSPPPRRKVTPVPAPAPVDPPPVVSPAHAGPSPVGLAEAAPLPPAEPGPNFAPSASAPAPGPAASAPPRVDVVEVIGEPSPSIRLGEYAKSVRWQLRQDILEWLVPGCVFVIFFLSFFSWHLREDYTLNLWQLAFTENGFAKYTFYVVVMVFLTMPVAGVVLALEKHWLPLPADLAPFWRYRSLVLAGMIGLPFLFLLGDYIGLHFESIGVRAAIPLKLAFRVHLVAVIACGLEFWLEQRKAGGLPLPRLTFRW